MFGRKDCEALAKIVREAREDADGGTSVDALLDEIQGRLAEFCGTKNDMFDEHVFNRACRKGR